MSDNTTSGSGALVVWSSAGRRLQFSRQDLSMPEHIHKLPKCDFFKKQWDKVADFWFNRVLKETALQRMQVSDIVASIEKDIERRWQHRKAEKALYKKKKRLLVRDGPAGRPSTKILITNICSLTSFLSSSEMDKHELVKNILKQVETVCKGIVHDVQILIDDNSSSKLDETAMKRMAVEGEGKREAVEKEFDDHVAIVCTLESKEKAALAIANLHGARFDGRTVVCCFHEPSDTREGL
ncbi:unnamed protein product [Phytomonas sp. EM1]|nr:unnamed protein product [Phytomonas sp. EM1]|eukprot:CCW65676.1 unnamed protein product [Phytomonas sp. isolate EM1]